MTSESKQASSTGYHLSNRGTLDRSLSPSLRLLLRRGSHLLVEGGVCDLQTRDPGDGYVEDGEEEKADEETHEETWERWELVHPCLVDGDDGGRERKVGAGDLPGVKNWYLSNRGPSTRVSLLFVLRTEGWMSLLRSVWSGWS